MVDIPIRFRIKLKDDTLKKFVYAQQRHAPVRFGYDVEHAEYREYGTGPARQRDKYWVGIEGKKALHRWVQKKLGISDLYERVKVVNSIAWNLHQNGMQPQPFWRPALNTVMSHLQFYYSLGWTLEQIAGQIGALASATFIHKGLPFDGAIERSWYVDKIPQANMDNVKADLETATSARSLAEMVPQDVVARVGLRYK